MLCNSIYAEVFAMKYLINDACLSCGACVPECPKNCIAMGDSIYVIDPEACIACGVCVGVCPADAIVQE
jgi:ferredoxin